MPVENPGNVPRAVERGIRIGGPAGHGRGYGRETIRLPLDGGFAEEGRRRKALRINGESVEDLVMGCFKERRRSSLTPPADR